MARLPRGQSRAAGTGTDHTTGELGNDQAPAAPAKQLKGSDPASTTQTEQLKGSDQASATQTEQLKPPLFTEVAQAIEALQADPISYAVPTWVVTTAQNIPTHYKTTRFGVALSQGEVNEVTFSDGSKRPLFLS